VTIDMTSSWYCGFRNRNRMGPPSMEPHLMGSRSVLAAAHTKSAPNIPAGTGKPLFSQPLSRRKGLQVKIGRGESAAGGGPCRMASSPVTSWRQT
jgi:hypothetical protein